MQWSPVTVSIALLAGFYALLILKTKIVWTPTPNQTSSAH